VTIFTLIIDQPDGIATLPLIAECSADAYDIGHELFPGRRLALVCHEPGDDDLDLD